MQNPIPLWRLAGSNYNIIRLAGISGCAAVVLGAYGAHRKFTPFDEQDDRTDLREVFNTANKFHLLHSVALLAVPLTRNPMIVSECEVFHALNMMTYRQCYLSDRHILHSRHHTLLWRLLLQSPNWQNPLQSSGTRWRRIPHPRLGITDFLIRNL